MAKKNVFIVGLDELNLHELRRAAGADQYAYHELLDTATARGNEVDPYPFDEVLMRTTRELEAFDGPIDAIVGYWDFPVAPMVAILAERFGTTAPSLESVVRCEHKYWSRLVQQEVIDDLPAFTAFNPFGDAAASAVRALGFPAWIKPVTGTGSMLGFRVDDEAALEEALQVMREQLPPIARGFNEMLAHLDLPEAVAGIDGCHAVAESIVSGHQCTVSGYTFGDEVIPYGVIDSINFPGKSSFQRYEYPSELPRGAQERMKDLTKRVIGRIGLRNATFNVEFFYDPDRDAINLLEVNPRMSSSHGNVYEKVDGLPNHSLLVDLGLGRRPTWHAGAGSFPKAAKFFIRYFAYDAHVRRVPTEDDLAAVHREIPDALITILPEAGGRLSDIPHQEPQSYALAHVYLGGQDRDDLLRKYERVQELLVFDLEPFDPRAQE